MCEIALPVLLLATPIVVHLQWTNLVYLLPDLGPWLFLTLSLLVATGLVRIVFVARAHPTDWHARRTRVETGINLADQSPG